jgi:hypothetical protein
MLAGEHDQTFKKMQGLTVNSRIEDRIYKKRTLKLPMHCSKFYMELNGPRGI